MRYDDDGDGVADSDDAFPLTQLNLAIVMVMD